MEIVVLILLVVNSLMLFYGLFVGHKIEQQKLMALHFQKEQELEVLRAGLREMQQKLVLKASRKGR